MRILITGGRDFTDRDLLIRTLDRLHLRHGFTVLIHGAARGADRMAAQWAVERGLAVLACPADWKRYGRSAGLVRNRQMLDEAPDLLIAFPGGKGTHHMVRLATLAGVQVVMATEIS